jgi:hypothetical protein
MNGRSYKRSKMKVVWRGTDDGSRPTLEKVSIGMAATSADQWGIFGSREVTREVLVG